MGDHKFKIQGDSTRNHLYFNQTLYSRLLCTRTTTAQPHPPPNQGRNTKKGKHLELVITDRNFILFIH